MHRGIWIATLAFLIAWSAGAAFLARPARVAPVFGVTFSFPYAESLGVDPREAFTAMVSDLNVRLVRLPIYWSLVEAEEGVYDWSDMDWAVAEAEAYGVSLVPVVGGKVPRWPECYIPEWSMLRGDEARKESQIAFVKQTVERYRASPAVARWQVENEPLFPFGNCPLPDPRLVATETALVRSLDDRDIQITASGELEPWFSTAVPADVLGISMYRITWNDFLGYAVYPFGPFFYQSRAWAVRPWVKKVVVSELQTEPWFPRPTGEDPLAWYPAFTAEDFRAHVSFARSLGFEEVFLWGVEWWYLLKVHGEPRLWEEARQTFVL